jgi:hypothetical protein
MKLDVYAHVAPELETKRAEAVAAAIALVTIPLPGRQNRRRRKLKRRNRLRRKVSDGGRERSRTSDPYSVKVHKEHDQAPFRTIEDERMTLRVIQLQEIGHHFGHQLPRVMQAEHSCRA